MTPELRLALLGCLEIPVFLKRGVERFGNTIAAVKLSLLALLMVIPLAAAFNGLSPGNTDITYGASVIHILFSWILSSVLFLGILFAMMGVIKDRVYFWRFVAIYNWLNLPSFLIQLPFLLVAALNWAAWETMQDYLILQLLFAYAYQAFAMTHTLKVHWTIAAAFSMIDLVCSSLASQITTDWIS